MRTSPTRLSRVLNRTALLVAAATTVAVTGACGGTGAGGSGGETVTVYSADGLDGWYATQFEKFEAETGIAVDLVAAGSGEVVNRLEKEQSNPQADVVVTLPPFIQKADSAGLLEPHGVDTAAYPDTEKDPAGKYVSLAGNYLNFIAHSSVDASALTWDDLLKPEYRGKLQYSTPGQAGDGTAVLILLQQLRGKQGALDYLNALQVNNVGPSSSTGKLQPKVDKGELLIANGDIQMNMESITASGSTFDIFFPASPGGAKHTVALPYFIGLAKGAPNSEGGRKLIEFLLSKDVQQTLGPDAFAVSARTDVSGTGSGTTPASLLEGVEIVRPDWSRVLAELDADLAAYNQAIGG
ncbi:2-aminoethylphosphonate ABC transporter substrate-binding protein [Nocardia puris]|uniref:2-aminoethylphosphonate ABC transporter substrate-binding protein n=1 Tax=Nocardia puris TaxID=208602 RepID=UPI0018957923|nr:2-aminoethylphosphonate ABC transporter substrate-binding protein [Nocardia puris]MBF6215448.1 2-aminoethylphosphonate ABC transporter substrate-binding protein [Nocardia puris]MBF6369112.1 2-aminoethylphosphonate ABC transporter substrate-binding protein [Nocardia puris]MBF6463313.1 2-aminoethylphosphonate ABC transporter substrate-binding protein [Nocardia puris]